MKKYVIYVVCLFLIGCASNEKIEKGVHIESNKEDKDNKTVENDLTNVKIIVHKGAKVKINGEDKKVEDDENYGYIFFERIKKGTYDIEITTKYFKPFSKRIDIDVSSFSYDLRKEVKNELVIKPEIEEVINHKIKEIMTKLFENVVQNKDYNEIKDIFDKNSSRENINRFMKNFEENLDIDINNMKNLKFKECKVDDKYKLIDNGKINFTVKLYWSYEPNISEPLELSTFSNIEVQIDIDDKNNILICEI